MKKNRKVIVINDRMTFSLVTTTLKENEMKNITGGGVFPSWLVDTLKDGWDLLNACL